MRVTYLRCIGSSIVDAIDWTQDLLQVQRPLAEAVLFSLLLEKKAKETEDGFMLFEDDDDDLRRKSAHMTHRPRFSFGKHRSSAKSAQHRTGHKAQTGRHMDYSDQADHMMDEDKKKKQQQQQDDDDHALL